MTKFKSFLQNHWANFNHPFLRLDNYEIAKIRWQIFKIFFSRTTGPISTKINLNHYLVKGIHVCSNEESRPFPKGDYYVLAKIHWWVCEIIFSRTTGPVSTKLGTNLFWVKGIQICSNEGPLLLPRGYNCEIITKLRK